MQLLQAWFEYTDVTCSPLGNGGLATTGKDAIANGEIEEETKTRAPNHKTPTVNFNYTPI